MARLVSRSESYTRVAIFPFLLMTALLSRNCASGQDLDTYKAAVVEYQPEGSPWQDTGPQIISKNLANYLQFIGNASANGVDIIVFPEYGLTTLGIPRDRDAAKPFLLSVPPIGSNPCREQLGSQAVQEMSCAAQSFNIYVVVNCGEIRDCTGQPNCPPDNVFQFNSNIVFDRVGNLVAKYEKANLYFEDQFDKPDPVQLNTFVTDFGVTFGLFTCFDIIFHDPAVALVEMGVQHFIFPTAWVDELPFLTAIQAQASWAYGSNSNLLGSGYHQPLGGQLGSGIYEGVRGAVTYTFDSDSGSTMLVGNLPTRPQPRHKIADVNTKFDSDVELKSNVAAYHSFLREDLQNYTTAVLNFALDQELLCTENEFCCQVNYKMRNVSGPISLENYRLVVFNGTRTVAAKTAEYDWQVCAVVRCLNYTLESCSENDKASSEIHLPNFETFQLKAFFDVKPETTEFLPTFNALDAQFALISPSLFSIETNVGENSAMQISSNSLGQVNIKTVALIKKVFETE
ncbi:pantetheinase isoform X3 [Folsomia candida]|uniref:pantetheinase isoform X3 n=1 Tax=Folsomia candida TaxID=158441 RepID=UPI000B903257|nr:pantetheinase isoform X3 [Folsomia candida]